MSEEEKQIMNKMIYCNLVSGEQALKFNRHIKEILQENEQLKDQLQQKENIIKEVREYILTHKLYCFEYDEEELFEITTDKKAKDEILKILDKVSDE